MRARHRHLNPKAFDAATALDARFLDLTNNAAVQTWTSRTGNNNVTQTTAARQPTFKSNIQGGQPVVRFSGAHTLGTQSFLQNTNFSVVQPFIAITATIVNTKNSYVFDATTGTRVAMGINDSGNAADNGKPWIWSTGVSGYPKENTDIRGSWQILCGVFDGTSSKIQRNGTQVATGNVGANNFATLKVGETSSALVNTTGHDGDISALIIYKGRELPLLKRITHHIAFSFKIACS